MTNEELLSVAEIVDRLVTRFHKQAADHETKMAEHRASFGARTSADAKIIEGLRMAAKRAGIDNLRNRLNALGIQAAKQAGEVLGMVEGEGLLGAAQRVVKERNGLLTQVQDQRAEIERLQAQTPKYKVGDKLEWQKLGLSPCSVTVTGIRLVYDCIGEGAEYPVGHSEDELRAIISHDTPAGKEAAEAVIRDSQMTEIKVGDVVEVVSNTGGNTWLVDVGSVGTVTSVETIEDSLSVRLADVPGKKNVLAGYVSLCDVRKVPQ